MATPKDEGQLLAERAELANAVRNQVDTLNTTMRKAKEAGLSVRISVTQLGGRADTILLWEPKFSVEVYYPPPF